MNSFKDAKAMCRRLSAACHYAAAATGSGLRESSLALVRAVGKSIVGRVVFRADAKIRPYAEKALAKIPFAESAIRKLDEAPLFARVGLVIGLVTLPPGGIPLVLAWGYLRSTRRSKGPAL